MSAYAARLKSEMKPMLEELKELNELDEPTAEQKSDIDRIAAALAEKKSEHDRAIERHQKLLGAQSMIDGLSEPAPLARAVYEGPSNGALIDDRKGWFDTLIETKGFKRAQSNPNDLLNIHESMPTGKLYPFFEQKAPFIVTNPALLPGGTVDIYGPALGPRRRHAILDLVRTVETNQYNINYLPLTFTNNAAEVAWGQPKPESTNAGTIQTITQTTIAHWKETVRQQLNYLPQLRGEIENELTEGVLTTLEYRIIRGTGVDPQMLGLLAAPTMTATGADLVSQIFMAIGAVEDAGGTVDAIAMNPADYATLIQGEYTNNQFNPLIQNDRFGTYRVVKSGAIPAGKALVGDWGMSVVLYIGDALRVAATEALGMKSNILLFLAEMDAVVLLARPWLMYECPGPLVALP
jgi:Phage capsid family